MDSTRIAVLESRWWSGRNTSVRGVFDLLSDLYYDNHHAYHYEMCNSGAAFEEALSRYVNGKTDAQYLSLACHGHSNGLKTYNGDVVTRAKIRNILKRDETNRSIVGLHFGSCLFGTQNLASFLFQDHISPWWIAGYGATVDFVRSTTLDMLFFQQIIEHENEVPASAIRSTGRFLKKNVPGLCAELQFGIYVVDDDTENVIDLLA